MNAGETILFNGSNAGVGPQNLHHFLGKGTGATFDGVPLVSDHEGAVGLVGESDDMGSEANRAVLKHDNVPSWNGLLSLVYCEKGSVGECRESVESDDDEVLEEHVDDDGGWCGQGDASWGTV